MSGKIKEKISVQLAKNPRRVVLFCIIVMNVAFIFLAALAIYLLSRPLPEAKELGFWETVYYTITMVFDAGCISSTIQELGMGSVVLIIVCLLVGMIGMLLFTGAVIGYLTSFISGFIENAGGANHKLYLHGHTVILNWNSRASEIINDLLYNKKKQKIVILVNSGKAEIQAEIDERIEATVAKENAAVKQAASEMPLFKRITYKRRNKFKNRLIVIIKEGDTFSTKQLHDISLEHAKSILILSNDMSGELCKYDRAQLAERQEKGNAQSIKALVQVAGITADKSSDDDQKIVVEADDDWTSELVKTIIKNKQVRGKCQIVPVRANRILGRLLSQFSIMPELNLAYRELFSNKGVTFYSKPHREQDLCEFSREYLKNHLCSLPLSIMKSDGETYAYYSAGEEDDDKKVCETVNTDFTVKLNYNFWFERKNVIILGHNSKIRDIMEGFNEFRNEWKRGDEEIMNIIVIDDKEHLERMNYYKDYPYVVKAVEADVYDRDVIYSTVKSFVDENDSDTSVLILSDDTVRSDRIDSNAIANLIYLRDIIADKKEQDPDFDEGKIDVVVEILNPKHYDIVKNYSVKNVVISNRYISKMITQLGEKVTLFDFYHDILAYDGEGADAYESKEIYVKEVKTFFEEIPPACTAAELIRAVYYAATDDSLAVKNHTVVLGYINAEGKMTLFEGNQSKIKVELGERDKLIVYSAH